MSPVGGAGTGTRDDPDGADALLERAAAASVDELLDLVRLYAGVDVAFVGEFTKDRRIIRFVRGEGAAATALVGRSHPLTDSYCRLIVTGAVPPLIPDVDADAELRDLAVTAELEIRSYAGVPIRLSDGALYGTLCGFGRRAGIEFPPDLVRLLEAVAELLARRLEAPENRFVDVLAGQDRIRAVLEDPDRIAIELQPIVDLATGATVGCEALARFPGDVPEPPDVWFADAHGVGLGVALEVAAARRALESMAQLPADAYLAINLCAAAISDDGLDDVLAGHDANRIVIELTETRPEVDVLPFGGREELRAAGLRLAVDDLGAGFAGLARLVEIDPEIVKLDRFLTMGVGGDPRRAAIAAAAQRFCADTGAALVAEGIENAEDRDAVRSLGIPYGQGFLLGAPAPAGAQPWSGAGARS